MSKTAKMELIKADSQGRTRYSPEYRQQALEAFKGSGQTAMAFAEHLGVKYSTFAAWASKASRSGPKPPPKPKSASPTFLLAEIADAAPATGVSVRFPGGMVAQASCHEQVVLLAALIKALA